MFRPRPPYVHFSPDNDGASGAASTDADRDAETFAIADDAGDAERGGKPKKEPETISGAGKRFLDGLSEEDRTRPFEGELEETDDDAPVDRQRAAVREGDEEGDGEDDGDDVIGRDSDGAEWKKVGGSYRWVLDGKFVDGEPPEGWVKPADTKRDTPADTTTGKPAADKEKGRDTAPDPDAPKLEKITLAGEKDRGEEDIEVEVDADIADRIRRAQNGALRRQVFERRQSALDQRQAAMDETELALAEDPVGFIINQVTPERRLELTRALLAEHLPELAAELEQWLENDGVRQEQRVKIRDRMKDSADNLSKARKARAYVKSVMDAVQKLVPEDTDDERAQDFIVDARRTLADLSDKGIAVTPENVKQHLARRLQLYGFDQPRRQTPPRRPDADRSAKDPKDTARPVSDRAREIADRRPSSKAAAAKEQDRVRRVQRARAASQRQTPAGAGVAPVEQPVLRPEDETDVRTASKALRKKGIPESWTGAGKS